MGKTVKKQSGQGIFDTLRSLQFGIVTLAAIAIAAMAGTIIPQGQPWEFYHDHYNPVIVFLIEVFRLDNTYGSPLFLGLMGIFGLNLVLCTVKRFPGSLKAAFRPNFSLSRERLEQMPISFVLPNVTLIQAEASLKNEGFHVKKTGDHSLFCQKGQIGHLGSTIVHLSLLLLLAGGMASLISGKRGRIVLYPGESSSLAELPGGNKIPLGFTLRLNRFEVEYYKDFADRPKSFTSSVTVTPRAGSPFQKDIRVNHPLMLNGFTIYQSSFGVSDNQDVPAANDTARVEIRLRGAPESMPPIAVTDMTPGGIYPVPGFEDTLQVRLLELHRNFRIDGSPEETNPAVKLDVLVRGESRWTVYAFQKYPGLNMPMHQDILFQFGMIGLRSGESGGTTAGQTEYYTVLGAVRDRGIPLMWSGAVIMMIGLFVSFYIRPRRLWAIEDNGGVVIGAHARGEADAFRDSLARAIRKEKTEIRK